MGHFQVTPERRRYYRIDDNAILSFKVIPTGQVIQAIGRFREGLPEYFSLAANFAVSDISMSEVLGRIRSEQPLIATYLDAVDQKLKLLAHLVMALDNDLSASSTQSVSLSGGGIAFDVNQEIPPGSTLEIKLILFPEYTGILTYGNVVQSFQNNSSADAPWRVAVNFSSIRESDRDLIIRHVLHQQATWLRRRQLDD
ncbi:PilZ domain-containing protein [Gammaproteobacteria bacterium]